MIDKLNENPYGPDRFVGKTIMVWSFEYAPKLYRELLYDRGADSDVDWIAFVPEALKNEHISWLESGSGFGCCAVEEFVVHHGILRVGYHS